MFSDGFSKYQESGDFSDLELVTQHSTYRVHRLVLVYSSEFFASLLTSDWKESSQPRVELKFDDEDNVFEDVLRFMYSGVITLTEGNSIPMLAMADKYLIQSLREQCTAFISRNINRHNALAMLERALRWNVSEIAEQCVQVIAKNFGQYQNELDWSFLPFRTLLRLLQHEYLAVKDEYQHFLKLLAYIDVHRSKLTDDNIRELMENIRFRWMSFQQLQGVEKNPLVPRDLLVEALMSRMAEKEGLKVASEDTRARLRPRVAFGMQFEYTYDLDEQGILHWISTSGNTQPWRNPHKTRRITVRASSVERGDPQKLVSRHPTELWTKDVPASWFSIDLGKNRSVRPTKYTLRHGGNYRADSLRNWDFQGSCNGNDWTLLRRHTNDCSLDAPFATNTWSIETDKAYRFFRILQTGHNSANHNFLVVSGIELYGDLYELFDTTAASATPTEDDETTPES